MIIHLHRRFEKQYAKLPKATKQKVKARLQLFITEPTNPILNNHAQQGKFKQYRSLNVTGDLRLIYKLLDEQTALFVQIGSHSELYG